MGTAFYVPPNKRYGYETTDTTPKNQFKVGAIILRGNRVDILKQRKSQKYGVAKGSLRSREAVDDAMIREVREEENEDISLDGCEYITSKKKPIRLVLAIVRLPDGSDMKFEPNDEIESAESVDIDDIDLYMSEGNESLRLLKDYLSGGVITLKNVNEIYEMI